MLGMDSQRWPFRLAYFIPRLALLATAACADDGDGSGALTECAEVQTINTENLHCIPEVVHITGDLDVHSISTGERPLYRFEKLEWVDGDIRVPSDVDVELPKLVSAGYISFATKGSASPWGLAFP